jgi:hypothetical protein
VTLTFVVSLSQSILANASCRSAESGRQAMAVFLVSSSLGDYKPVQWDSGSCSCPVENHFPNLGGARIIVRDHCLIGGTAFAVDLTMISALISALWGLVC